MLTNSFILKNAEKHSVVLEKKCINLCRSSLLSQSLSTLLSGTLTSWNAKQMDKMRDLEVFVLEQCYTSTAMEEFPAAGMVLRDYPVFHTKESPKEGFFWPSSSSRFMHQRPSKYCKAAFGWMGLLNWCTKHRGLLCLKQKGSLGLHLHFHVKEGPADLCSGESYTITPILKWQGWAVFCRTALECLVYPKTLFWIPMESNSNNNF